MVRALLPGVCYLFINQIYTVVHLMKSDPLYKRIDYSQLLRLGAVIFMVDIMLVKAKVRILNYTS